MNRNLHTPRQLNKLLSIALVLVLTLGIILGIPIYSTAEEYNGDATTEAYNGDATTEAYNGDSTAEEYNDNNTKYATGLEDTIVAEDDVTIEEYANKAEEESATNFVNAAKGTDSYWAKFSVPYYSYQEGLSEGQIALYNKLYSSLYSMIDGGVDFTDTYKKDDGEIVYLTPAVTFNGISNREAVRVGYMMLYEHPELYYLNTVIKIDRVAETDDYYIRLGVYEDFISGKARAEYSAALADKINWYLEQVTGETVYDKELKIHDLICENVVYDKQAKYTQSIASALLDGRSVCAGYAESFVLLCRAFDIPATTVTSEPHEWSEVKLGDYWYAVDVTWDDQSGNYNYFNKSDDTIKGYSEAAKTNHTVESEPWDYVGRPACNYDYGDEQGYVELYRLCHPFSGEHFYTTSFAEAIALADVGWSLEGVACRTPKTSNEPIYRFYMPLTGDHFYTNSAVERDALIASGNVYEGIAWYSDTNKAKPIYRLYNPAAFVGSHHYTSNLEEVWTLISTAGWQYEGVGWYGL